jgi:2-haloacid dehalogenase
MAASSALDDIGACVFDAYGTIFDFAAAAARCRDELGDKADALSDLWRTKQLQYTWLRSLMGSYADFWQVTGDALDFSLSSLDIDDPALRQRLMDLYLRLDTFPEIAEMLQALKTAGIRTAILSNGSPDMLTSAVEGAGLQNLLDEVFSVDSLSVFKPDPSVYQLAVDGLGVDAGRICFMSSNAWDASGAANFGFRVVWCNRYGQRPERLPGDIIHEVTTLAELPGLLGI